MEEQPRIVCMLGVTHDLCFCGADIPVCLWAAAQAKRQTGMSAPLRPWMFPFRIALIVVILCGTRAWAQDLVKDSIPNKWIEQFVPEDLPALSFPSYYNDLDQAKALSFHGRF